MCIENDSDIYYLSKIQDSFLSAKLRKTKMTHILLSRLKITNKTNR